MRKNENTETIEGRVYEHDLTLKTVQNQQSENYGKEFINGSISVATDEAGLNVLSVHYTYVTEMTKSGQKNPTFANLKRVMEGKTWVTDGKDAAVKVRLQPSAALNDFYPNGGDELVSQQRNEGGFVTILSELRPEGEFRQRFQFDAVINGVNIVETENPEDEYARINCVIFNFRNDILPFSLIARDKNAINYFVSLDPSASNPVYTKVWGQIVNTTVKEYKTVESAFGEPAVDVTEKHQREWVVTGAKPEPYIFDNENTITAAELQKAIASRNVYLEDVKARAKEYYASRNAVSGFTAAPTANTSIPAGGFNF